MKALSLTQMPLGADVEFLFLDENGDPIEAKTITGKGIACDDGKITPDGVLGEINPDPNNCRQILRSYIWRILRNLSRHNVSFKSNVTLSDEFFNTLSPESKEFGCNPSFDVYNEMTSSIAHVKGSETRQRTCGGHIHIGFDWIYYKEGNFKFPLNSDKNTNIHSLDITNELDLKLSNYASAYGYKYEKKGEFLTSPISKALVRPEMTVPLIDLFCGIPSVLVDRDENARFRRHLYGKAGECRLPKYGIEYRTLSNFWLKSYMMMSLFTGLARYAVIVASECVNDESLLKEIYSRVSPEEVRDAINNNDFNLARDIFLRMEDFYEVTSEADKNHFPLNTVTIPHFKQMIVEKYIQEDDVLESWGSDREYGWESLCSKRFPFDDDVNKNFLEMSV